MGECLITRRGGNSYKLPILNENYPADVSVTVIEGNTTSATFTAVIDEPGSPAVYTYQWYKNGTAVEGATSSSYVVNDIAVAETSNVYCEVTNKKGTVTTRVALLQVVLYGTPLLNTSYPQDATVASGNSVTNKVEIATDGNPATYTYQWYKNGTDVEGATDSSYTFTPNDSGSTTVYCEVSNSAGTVKSRSATIKEYLDIVPNTGISWGSVGTHGEQYAAISKGAQSTVFSFQSQAKKAYAYYAVDVTKYKTMRLKGSGGGGDGSGTETYQVGLAASASGSIVVGYSASGVKISPSVDKSYDISSLTGTMYIVASYQYAKTTSTPHTTLTMTRIRLEE